MITAVTCIDCAKSSGKRPRSRCVHQDHAEIGPRVSLSSIRKRRVQSHLHPYKHRWTNTCSVDAWYYVNRIPMVDVVFARPAFCFNVPLHALNFPHFFVSSLSYQPKKSLLRQKLEPDIAYHLKKKSYSIITENTMTFNFKRASNLFIYFLSNRI